MLSELIKKVKGEKHEEMIERMENPASFKNKQTIQIKKEKEKSASDLPSANINARRECGEIAIKFE